MTTAHKPTWNAAVGSSEQGGSLRGVASRQVSSKDQTAHTKLHFRHVPANLFDFSATPDILILLDLSRHVLILLRQAGQHAPTDIKKRDFRRELEERERRYREEKGIDEPVAALPVPLQIASEERDNRPQFNPLDRDDSFSSSSSDSDSESSERYTADGYRWHKHSQQR